MSIGSIGESEVEMLQNFIPDGNDRSKLTRESSEDWTTIPKLLYGE